MQYEEIRNKLRELLSLPIGEERKKAWIEYVKFFIKDGESYPNEQCRLFVLQDLLFMAIHLGSITDEIQKRIDILIPFLIQSIEKENANPSDSNTLTNPKHNPKIYNPKTKRTEPLRVKFFDEKSPNLFIDFFYFLLTLPISQKNQQKLFPLLNDQLIKLIKKSTLDIEYLFISLDIISSVNWKEINENTLAPDLKERIINISNELLKTTKKGFVNFDNAILVLLALPFCGISLDSHEKHIENLLNNLDKNLLENFENTNSFYALWIFSTYFLGSKTFRNRAFSEKTLQRLLKKESEWIGKYFSCRQIVALKNKESAADSSASHHILNRILVLSKTPSHSTSDISKKLNESTPKNTPFSIRLNLTMHGMFLQFPILFNEMLFGTLSLIDVRYYITKSPYFIAYEESLEELAGVMTVSKEISDINSEIFYEIIFSAINQKLGLIINISNEQFSAYPLLSIEFLKLLYDIHDSVINMILSIKTIDDNHTNTLKKLKAAAIHVFDAIETFNPNSLNNDTLIKLYEAVKLYVGPVKNKLVIYDDNNHALKIFLSHIFSRIHCPPLETSYHGANRQHIKQSFRTYIESAIKDGIIEPRPTPPKEQPSANPQ